MGQLKSRKEKAKEIREIVQKSQDMIEATDILIEEGHAVSRAEGKRIYIQLKERMANGR